MTLLVGQDLWFFFYKLMDFRETVSLICIYLASFDDKCGKLISLLLCTESILLPFPSRSPLSRFTR